MIMYFDVNLEEELVETVKPYNQIICAVLCKIGLKKINDDHWICKVDEETTKQGFIADVGQETNGVQSSGIAGEHNANIPNIPPVDRGEPLSKFEQMLHGRLDTIKKDHFEFCVVRFQNLDDQIEVVQDCCRDALWQRYIGSRASYYLSYFDMFWTLLLLFIFCIILF